jgi:sugar lactone lactonase YvrE
MMQTSLTVLLILAVSLALSSCDGGPSSASDGSGLPDGTYIDEPIILAGSEPQTPIHSVHEEYVYDFSRVALVSSLHYTDLEISYVTPTSCDEDVYVFNFQTQSWAQIGFAPISAGCAQFWRLQTHLFSAKGLVASEYLNESFQMRVRTRMAAPTIRALRLNPDYRAIPLSHLPQGTFDGITFDGQSLWLSSRWPATLYSLSITGDVLKSFPAPSDYPFGLAFDGQFLWLADGTDRIFKLTPDGANLGHFDVPTDFPGGITWDGRNLWLTEYQGRRLHTYSIDATLSCASGSAILVDSMDTPGGGSWGLAWNGSELLVANTKDSLYVFRRNGVVLRSYSLPVVEVSDLTWDGQAIWIVNHGPKGTESRDPLITRLRIRW